jgi:hypothetical protein
LDSLRAIEGKYGKVVEAQFLEVSLQYCPTCLLKQQYFQDNEKNIKYQKFSYVVFRDEQSLERIPKTGRSFYILEPGVDRPDGLELDDIRHLLERDEFFEFTSAASHEVKKIKVISGNIEPSGMSSLSL